MALGEVANVVDTWEEDTAEGMLWVGAGFVLIPPQLVRTSFFVKEAEALRFLVLASGSYQSGASSSSANL